MAKVEELYYICLCLQTGEIQMSMRSMADYAWEIPEEKLEELIAGKFVRIKAQQKSDRYGRLIVWAYTPDGEDVSAEMLKAGLSWHFRKYDNSAIYSQLENEARKNRFGIWPEANPVSPWDFRKNSNKRFLKRLR